MLTEITLENFRCFHEQQTARLAPLTLLVGENSTGKTSFLALLRALAEFANTGETPRFTEPPYDLGSFADIVHHAEGNLRPQSFDAGFTAIYPRRGLVNSKTPISFSVTFEEHAATPVPVRRRISHDEAWIEDRLIGKTNYSIIGHTCRGDWDIPIRRFGAEHDELSDYSHTLGIALRPLRRASIQHADIDASQFRPISASPEITEADIIELQNIAEHYFFSYRGHISDHIYAGAPIRSQPQRTYRPAHPTPDPEGNYIPSYFADRSVRYPNEWRILKESLEKFGRDAGLFSSIDIMQYGEAGSGPFEVQIYQGNDKPQRARNLIDMGYGVSQILPIITELQRPIIPRRAAPAQYLLQQPEVHLHPSAQAALGSLLYDLASEQRQLFVETHSDYVVDRIRMDVRDRRTALQDKDVSILYFERNGTDVTIHSLELDEEGQINGQPESYRKFFAAEVRRQLEL